MKFRTLGLYFALVLGPVACATSPTTPSGTITVTVAAPATPANGAVIANTAQPVTLSITNAVVTDSSAFVTYRFEVASDSGFTTVVATKDVPQAGGQTSVKLDVLPAGKDYFWHVRTTGSDTTSAFTAPVKFTIGPAVILQTPSAPSPAPGTTLTGVRPTLTVTNAQRTGPAGTITYKFEVATDTNFATIVTSGTVPEGATQTAFVLSSDLAFAKTYFWHVQAIDASHSISGAFSPTWTFVTPAAAAALWPGIQPPGTSGHAVLGDNWELQNLVSVDGQAFVTPSLEMRRVFDLLDRGMDPEEAINWMNANGYPTIAAWFPRSSTIGFEFTYMALISGRWDVVIRQE